MTKTISYPKKLWPFHFSVLAVIYPLKKMCTINVSNHTINWFTFFKSLFGNNQYWVNWEKWFSMNFAVPFARPKFPEVVNQFFLILCIELECKFDICKIRIVTEPTFLKEIPNGSGEPKKVRKMTRKRVFWAGSWVMVKKPYTNQNAEFVKLKYKQVELWSWTHKGNKFTRSFQLGGVRLVSDYPKWCQIVSKLHFKDDLGG